MYKMIEYYRNNERIYRTWIDTDMGVESLLKVFNDAENLACNYYQRTFTPIDTIDSIKVVDNTTIIVYIK